MACTTAHSAGSQTERDDDDDDDTDALMTMTQHLQLPLPPRRSAHVVRHSVHLSHHVQTRGRVLYYANMSVKSDRMYAVLVERDALCRHHRTHTQTLGLTKPGSLQVHGP